jgi:CDGSH-type Zn-finger protein
MRLICSENASVLVERDGRSRITRAGREQTADRVRIALCRCGESGSKPACDMTHVQVGFVAPRTEIVPLWVDQGDEQEGRMKITATENGPNKVEVEGAGAWGVTRDGDEETITRPAIFLCRCGHSENKPFCDGTHNKIGFTAPLVEIVIAPSG